MSAPCSGRRQRPAGRRGPDMSLPLARTPDLKCAATGKEVFAPVSERRRGQTPGTFRAGSGLRGCSVRERALAAAADQRVQHTCAAVPSRAAPPSHPPARPLWGCGRSGRRTDIRQPPGGSISIETRTTYNTTGRDARPCFPARHQRRRDMPAWSASTPAPGGQSHPPHLSLCQPRRATTTAIPQPTDTLSADTG